MKNNIIPNLFLIGWTRTGTSSLHEYLKQHPEVFMSPLKGPAFFGNIPNSRFPEYHHDKKKYLSLFKGVKKEKIIGESTHYHQSKSVPKEIKKFNSKSKIIIIIRNPVELLFSAYKGGKIPKEENFERSLQKHPEIVKDIESSFNFAEIIEDYFKEFGRKNVLVILTEELDNKKELNEILCNFLKINNKFDLDLERYGVSKEFKNQWIRKLIDFLPNKLKIKFKSNLSKKNSQRLRKLMKKIVSGKEIKEKIPLKLKKQLMQKFEKEIEKTSKLIDKDLKHWIV
jgi:hypothetical protein